MNKSWLRSTIASDARPRAHHVSSCLALSSLALTLTPCHPLPKRGRRLTGATQQRHTRVDPADLVDGECLALSLFYCFALVFSQSCSCLRSPGGCLSLAAPFFHPVSFTFSPFFPHSLSLSFTLILPQPFFCLPLLFPIPHRLCLYLMGWCRCWI